MNHIGSRLALAVLLASLGGAANTARPLPENRTLLVPTRVVDAHNAARRAAGQQPIEWDDALGKQAARYAFQLALSNRFAHSDYRVRNGAGENLWMGTRGAFSVNSMIGDWLSEGRSFRAGVFPVVSRTGNWRDVGHYTQIVWPATRKVGCALATNASADYLVCHYWPAGNVQGVALNSAAFRFAAR